MRSSMTSMSSLGTASYGQSSRPITPYSQYKTPSFYEQSLNSNVHPSKLGAKLEIRSPLPARALPLTPNPKNLPMSCLFPGHSKTFKRKGDWKSHMDDFHKPGPVVWHCEEEACEDRFETKLLFQQHHTSIHKCGRTCTHADRAQRPSSPKLAFACGFECREGLFSQWETWRDHVREHLLRGSHPSDWSYTIEIRNLLRRKEISPLWESYIANHCAISEGHEPIFKWDADNKTSFLKQQLEFGSLRQNGEHLIKQVILAGVRVQSGTEFCNQLLLPVNASSPTATTNFYMVPESNAAELLSSPDLMNGNAFQSPAYRSSYNTDQSSFQFSNFLSPSAIPEETAGGSAWTVPEVMDSGTLSAELAQPSFEYRDFWYPSVHPNAPDVPVATYGLPLDVADSLHSQQEPRSKLADMWSKISSGRKSSHSRTGSDGSDHRMEDTQHFHH
ncbi:hypothetical protein BLS_003649 [Venturia inaequalis]|uniref:C2H2-type domain-containing protein n=1 Tax=Venturia inaequalis TaxID=5025 RepID=A0A8H3UNE5_VENIN|nr:hypothetical protein BLS_003649 [Venturia inaequalis]